jgi:DinB superfamily
MLSQSLLHLLRRELGAARRELEAYTDEALIWAPVPGLPNSAGILTRHIAGNLQHYVGTVLGGSGYLRDREAEFNAPPWPRERLIAELRSTEDSLTRVLPSLTPEQLAGRYPEPVAQHQLGTADFLIHLAVHCGFHLGQIDAHRRAATGDRTSIAPMAIPALASARPAGSGSEASRLPSTPAAS